MGISSLRAFLVGVLLVVALGGCREEGAPAMPVALETDVRPMEGVTSPGGYVSTFFDFGIGFDDAWQVISREKLMAATGEPTDENGSLIALRLLDDAGEFRCRLYVSYQRLPTPSITPTEWLRENAAPDASLTEFSTTYDGLTLGGRPVGVMTMDGGRFGVRRLYIFFDRGYVIRFSIAGDDRAAIVPADFVINTLTFYE